MTRARAWPNNAREARDRAAEEAVRGIRALVTNGRDFTETERLRRAASALDALQTIVRFLESVGAQTRPQ